MGAKRDLPHILLNGASILKRHFAAEVPFFCELTLIMPCCQGRDPRFLGKNAQLSVHKEKSSSGAGARIAVALFFSEIRTRPFLRPKDHLGEGDPLWLFGLKLG
jgi:hypothetical protein